MFIYFFSQYIVIVRFLLQNKGHCFKFLWTSLIQQKFNGVWIFDIRASTDHFSFDSLFSIVTLHIRLKQRILFNFRCLYHTACVSWLKKNYCWAKCFHRPRLLNLWEFFFNGVSSCTRTPTSIGTCLGPKVPLWDIFIPSFSTDHISHNHANISFFHYTLFI